MAFVPQIDVGAALADVDIFSFPGAGQRSSGSLPRIVSLLYDADSAVAVEIYLAPAGGGTGADRTPLIVATSASESRFCLPVWITAAGVPWHLFITKPTTGGAGTAFVRLEWDAGNEGR